MRLAIDAGNTQLKMAVFDGDEIKESIKLSYLDGNFDNDLKSWTSKDLDSIGLVTVTDNRFLEKIISYCQKKLTVINTNSTFPFKISYSSPETLGVDRIVACAGAHYLNNQQGNFLVIDAGTCITYDFVNAQNQYEGGAISPGVKIRAKSLQHYTSKLPLVDIKKSQTDLIGKNTNDSIKSGVINGLIHEAQGYILKIKSMHPELKVFLTGGDAFFFEDALKSSIFAEEKLVLIGMNELLKINA